MQVWKQPSRSGWVVYSAMLAVCGMSWWMVVGLSPKLLPIRVDLCRYMDQKGSAAMLTSIQSAGVASEVNLRIIQMRKHAKRDPPWLWNRADVTRSPRSKQNFCPRSLSIFFPIKFKISKPCVFGGYEEMTFLSPKFCQKWKKYFFVKNPPNLKNIYIVFRYFEQLNFLSHNCF